jgi:group I intron endonuclease
MKHCKLIKTAGVYCITNLIDNKKYIGSSINIQQRFYQHNGKLKKNNHENCHLQKAFNKYGESNFIFKILEKADNQDLLAVEQKYIDLHTAYIKDTGYNKNKFADANRNQPRGEASPNAKIYKLISPDGKLIKIRGLKEFCLKKNLDRRQLQRVLGGKYYQHKGWRKYSKSELNKKIPNNLFTQKNRTLLNPQNKIIKFSNLREFCRDNDLYRIYVSKLLKGEINEYKGWKVKK